MPYNFLTGKNEDEITKPKSGGYFNFTTGKNETPQNSTQVVQKAVESIETPSLLKRIGDKYKKIGKTGANLSASFVTELGSMGGRILDQVFNVASMASKRVEKKVDQRIDQIQNFGVDSPVISKAKDIDFSKKIEDRRLKIKDSIQGGAQFAREYNPLSETFAGKTAGAIGGMVPQVALALAKVPNIALSLSESFMNVEDSYDENIKNGMEKKEALKRAVPQLGADLLGTYVTNKLGTLGKLGGSNALFTVGKTTASKWTGRVLEYLKDAGLEVAQEVWQTGLQNLATDKPFTEGMSETAKLTIIPSLLFGLPANIHQIGVDQVEEKKTEIKQKIKEEVDRINIKIQNNEKLTEDEVGLFAVTNGEDPFKNTGPTKEDLEAISSQIKSTSQNKGDTFKVSEDPLFAEARKYKSAEEFVKSSDLKVEYARNKLKVAEDAKPITVSVYHGSPDARFAEEFNPNKAGYFKDAPDLLPDNTQWNELYGKTGSGFKTGTGVYEGISFTDDISVAKSYSNKPAFDSQNSVPMVLERTVSLKKPKVIDVANKEWDMPLEKTIAQAKKEGYDGIIFKNIRDNYHPSTTKNASNNIIVFSTDQIKTKSQLTDIWNEVNKTETPTFSREKGKESLDDTINTIDNKTYDTRHGEKGSDNKRGDGTDIFNRDREESGQEMAPEFRDGDVDWSGVEAQRRISRYTGGVEARNRIVARYATRVSQGRQIVPITEDTAFVLNTLGFSKVFTDKLMDVHSKGGVSNIVVYPKNEEGLSAGFGGVNTLYLNQSDVDSELYLTGKIINHEIDGHSWYTKLSPENRLSFYENLKTNKELIKQAWNFGDNPVKGYWKRTVKQVQESLLSKVSEQKMNQMMVDVDFVFNDNISVDQFIEDSFLIEKKIELLNAELERIGKEPMSIKAEDTFAINEHVAMIAENSRDLSTENPTLNNYISDIQTDSLTFGNNAVTNLAYQGETDLTTRILKDLEGKTTVSKQYILDATNRGELKQIERDIIRQVLDDMTGTTAYHQSQSKFPFTDFIQKGDKGYKKASYSQAGEGIYFSPNKELVQSKYGKDGGKLIEASLSMKKPLSLGTNDAMYFDGRKVNYGDIVTQNFKREMQGLKPLPEPDIVLTNISKKAKKWLQDNGYDSVKGMEGDMFSAPEYVVLDKSQIKVGINDTINVKEFADKVKSELLPLKVGTDTKAYEQAKAERNEIFDKWEARGISASEAEIKFPEEYQKLIEANKKMSDARAGSFGGESLKYENITLPEELRGDVARYDENIYQSPVKTSAGQSHFRGQKGSENYFGHTRIEDMADDQTRRVIEVQSDLFQKGNLEREKLQKGDLSVAQEKSYGTPEQIKQWDAFSKKNMESGLSNEEKNTWDKLSKSLYERASKERDIKLQKLQQYSNPTAHFRMVREEAKKAAQDGKTKLQFPTGETAMKIEGLVNRADKWVTLDNTVIKDGSEFKVGDLITYQTHEGTPHEYQRYLITENKGDGTFKAVDGLTAENDSGFYELLRKKDLLDDGRMPTLEELVDTGNMDTEIEKYLSKLSESLSAKDTVDINNPIYKFYEKDLARYLKNNFNAVPVTDDKGVTWMEVSIDPKMAEQPVLAFREKGQEDIEKLRRQLEREQQNLDIAVANPELHAKTYGEGKMDEYRTKIENLRKRIREAKNPTFDTENRLNDVRQVLAFAENRVGISPVVRTEKQLEEVKKTIPGETIAKKAKSIPASKISLPENIQKMENEVNNFSLMIRFSEEKIKDHPGQKLQKLISRKEGEFLDQKNPNQASTQKEKEKIIERNEKISRLAQSALEGTPDYKNFDDPDVIRQYIDEYKELKKNVDELRDSRRISQKEYREAKNAYILETRERVALNGIVEKEERLNALREVEKVLRKEGRDRKSKVNAVQDYFKLSNSEIASIIGNADFRVLTDQEFENFMTKIKMMAFDLQRHREAIMQLEYTIKENELKKVENLRKALKLPKFENMSIGQIEEFDALLSSFMKGDEFLGTRQLQTLKHTNFAQAMTHREILEGATKEYKERTGEEVTVDKMGNVGTLGLSEKIMPDTALSQQNPFFRLMVDNYNEATMGSNQKMQEFVDELNKYMENARKSRVSKSFIGKIAQKFSPIDTNIFDYLSATPDQKIEQAKKMTPAELDAAHFIKEKYEDARNYLLQQKVLKRYIQNYITHSRRGFWESLLHGATEYTPNITGTPEEKTLTKSIIKRIAGAVKESTESQQQDKAYMNILNEKTGEILPLEKFFQFSMARSGKLIPTKNVAKAVTQYFRAFYKKEAYDSFIPKIDSIAHALTPKGTTERGVELDDSIKRFVKEWLNSKKGRVPRIAIVPGSKVDWFVRSAVMLRRILDLGFNLPGGLISNYGEQHATLTVIGYKKYARGVARMNTKKGKEIAKKYESFVGESIFKRLREKAKDIPDKFYEASLGLYADSSRRANIVSLLGEMTPEEFKSGTMSKTRLADLKREMGRWRNMDGGESTYAKTAEGSIILQNKGWLQPIIFQTQKDVREVIKTLKARKNPLKTKETHELIRGPITAVVFALISYGIYKELEDKKDKDASERAVFKLLQEMQSLLSGFSPAMYVATPRLLGFFQDLAFSLTDIAKSLATGDRTQEGKIKGLEKFVNTISPSAIRQFKNNEETPEEKAVSSLETSIYNIENYLEDLDDEVLEKVQGIYDHTKELGFGTKEADDYINSDEVSDNEYAIFKKMRELEKKQELIDLIPKVQPIAEEALELGLGTEEADKLVSDSFPETPEGDKEFEAYSALIKSMKLTPEYTQGEEVKEEGLIHTISTYAKAIGTDPITAFNRIFTGQRIRRVDNKAIIVERLPLKKSEGIKKERGSTKDMRLDHKIGLQLGGSNDEDNLILVSKEEWESYTPVENYLGKLLREEKITKKLAQELIVKFKNKEVTFEEIKNLTK